MTKQEFQIKIESHINFYERVIKNIELYTDASVKQHFISNTDIERYDQLKELLQGVQKTYDILIQIKEVQISEKMYKSITSICSISSPQLQWLFDITGSVPYPRPEAQDFYLFSPQQFQTNTTTVLLAQIQKNLSILKILYGLGGSTKNVVVLGANGSGKSFLTNLFKQIPNNQYVMIPAYRNLDLPILKILRTEPLLFTSITETYRQATTNNLLKDNEFAQAFGSLIDQYQQSANIFLENSDNSVVEKPKLLFKIVLDLWNELMNGYRKLEYNNGDLYSLQVIDMKTQNQYDIHGLSDGEKTLLYLIMVTLLTPENTFILVDEPEVYLHKAIINKLWDRLEQLRNDCQFIYLTHDVDFAVSRDATKMWIELFTHPDTWKLQEIKGNEIPQELYMMLLGSRRPILFCEGKDDNDEENKKNDDIKYYELLFPEFTIAPVSGCKDVINCTKAFNNSTMSNIKAYGIIDRDHRSSKQISDLELKDNIFTLGFSEIENILLDEKLLREVGKKCNVLDLEKAISNIQNKIKKSMDSDKEELIARFIANKIEYKFKEKHIKGKKIKIVANSFKQFIDSIKIDELLAEKTKEIDKIIKNQDYREIITKYNNKGLKKNIKEEFGIHNYKEQAFDYIRSNVEIRQYLKEQANKSLSKIKAHH